MFTNLEGSGSITLITSKESVFAVTYQEQDTDIPRDGIGPQLSPGLSGQTQEELGNRLPGSSLTWRVSLKMFKPSQ